MNRVERPIREPNLYLKSKTPEDWFYSANMSSYQKVNSRVYVYLTPMMWGYHMLQLYLRGPNPVYCILEARHTTDREYLIQLGEKWLEQYAAGNIDEINQDPYAINNPDGVWHKDRHLEAWWIGGK